MPQNSGNFVDSFDFSRIKTAGDVMDVFIRVARYYPDQANKLFDKYVDFLQSTHPGFIEQDVRDLAAANISCMSCYYGKRVSGLLCNAYDGLRQNKK